jgi:silicon transporter
MTHSEDPLSIFKNIYSVGLLIFSIVVVCALIFEEQTSLSQDVHPALAFVCLWAALLWLSMVEGGQASMVGLPPVDRTLYEKSHPISHAICEWGHRGDNLDRYLMGRQFMVLALVFVINLSGAPLADAEVLNLPDILIKIFLGSGLAMILITCMIGQLNTQVNASHCMLDYINTHFMTFTLYVAMGIEASGLLHASYLIQIIVAKLAGKPLVSKEPPRDGMQNLLFWSRVLLSCAILVAAFTFTLGALFDGKTTMWEGIPPYVSVIFFFGLMALVGMLEGMQIAFFAVAKITEEERNKSVWAGKTCELLFCGEGRNLPGFMVGRQLMVVSCFFIIARCTTMDIEDGESNVLGVSDGIQKFFDTGLLGALITTIVASIAWQLVASAFPMAFLSTPITYILLRACLLLEATGICNGAWVIAKIHKKVAGFQLDEVYIGTAEERAARNHADNEDALSVEAGHLYPGVPALPPNYERHLTLEEIEEAQKKIAKQQAELENRQKNLTETKEKLLNAELHASNSQVSA